jgi:glycosyltransferase involved in cell wall biosynthesis
MANSAPVHPTTVAYMGSGYPRVTDAFITREIAGVEACGITVERFAIRAPAEDKITGPDQRRERDLTTYLLGGSKPAMAIAVAKVAIRSPRRFMSSVKLALATRRAGIDGSLRHLAYFVEAAVLAGHMRQRKVDHLHNHFCENPCTVSMLASEMTGIPYSFTIHGPAIFFGPVEWALETKMNHVTFSVAISMFAKSQASIYCDPSRWDTIHVVHCGVEDLQASETDERDPARLELLYVGRLEPVKGVPVLFDAVRQLVDSGRNVRLTVVGNGALREDLERRTDGLGLGDAIRFVGYRSQPEIRQHLAESDALVLPSFAEGVPVSLMEAMSQERAVVATSVGGVTELVKHGVNGLVVTPGDPLALAEALMTLADDVDLRHAMGVAGRATVRAEFDSATEARRLVALFRDPEGTRGIVRPNPVALPG